MNIISGIYQIINNINGKSYIGSSENINKRWKRHIRDLNKENHHCIYLQRSWIKYGSENFHLIILEETNDLFVREQYYIDLLKPEYNIGSVGGGDNITNHPNYKEIAASRAADLQKWRESLTEEDKLAIREKMKGEGNPNWRGGVSKIYCHCGKQIQYNVKECVKCYDKSGSKNPFYGKKHSEETKNKLRNNRLGKKPANSKPVSINSIIYPSATEAARQLNIRVATIIWRTRSNNVKFINYFYI